MPSSTWVTPSSAVDATSGIGVRPTLRIIIHDFNLFYKLLTMNNLSPLPRTSIHPTISSTNSGSTVVSGTKFNSSVSRCLEHGPGVTVGGGTFRSHTVMYSPQIIPQLHALYCIFSCVRFILCLNLHTRHLRWWTIVDEGGAMGFVFTHLSFILS